MPRQEAMIPETSSAGNVPPSGNQPIRVLHHSVPPQRGPTVSYMIGRGRMALEFPDHPTHGAIVERGQRWVRG